MSHRCNLAEFKRAHELNSSRAYEQLNIKGHRPVVLKEPELAPLQVTSAPGHGRSLEGLVEVYTYCQSRSSSCWARAPTSSSLSSSKDTATPRAVAPTVSANPSPGRAHDPSWGIWPFTVPKSRTLKEPPGTAEVSTKRDNDAALALGARPIQQHEPAARHMSQYWKPRSTKDNYNCLASFTKTVMNEMSLWDGKGKTGWCSC